MPDMAYADADFVLLRDVPPAAGETVPTRWVRATTVVVGHCEVTSPASFTRAEQPDEWMLLLPDPATQCTVTAAGETTAVGGGSLVTVPPGPSRVDVSGGRVVRIFTTRSAELAALAANADSYRVPHPHVAPPVPLPVPPGGYRIRAYPLDAPVAEGTFGRIWRCTTLMVNYLYAADGPRDTSALSPHSHDDFEQITLALDGDHVHHLRWPWGRNLAGWRPDVHRQVPAPSAAVIPARAIHTTQAIGPGLHQLADIFCPPRQDFADSGWVLNAADYPVTDSLTVR